MGKYFFGLLAGITLSWTTIDLLPEAGYGTALILTLASLDCIIND